MIRKTEVERDGSYLLRRLIRQARTSLAETFSVTLSIHGDFQAFCQVDREGGYAFGAYDNRFTRATRGTCIIVRHQGRKIGTYACGLFDAHPSMADVMEGPGLYFDGSDDHLRIEGPSARQWFQAMRGKVGFSGGIWVSKHYRGTPLSRTLVPLLPLVGRAIAVECWDVDHVFAMMPEQVMRKGIGQRYRLSITEPGITWHHRGSDIAMWFGYHPPLMIVHDALSFAERGLGLFDDGNARHPRTAAA
jgi:hypothetical protein